MKKAYSIFVITLILYLSVININPAHAEFLDNFCSETDNINSIQKAGQEYLNENIQYTCNTTEENEEVREVFQHNTQQLYITGSDIDLMAKLVSAESIGEPYEGKVAVACVVLNRTISPNFPNTIQGVIFQKNAFSCVQNGNIRAVANQDCYNAVYDAIKGSDPTHEALFFYNPSISTCSWMKNTPKTNETKIGHHTFFKLKT